MLLALCNNCSSFPYGCATAGVHEPLQPLIGDFTYLAHAWVLCLLMADNEAIYESARELLSVPSLPNHPLKGQPKQRRTEGNGAPIGTQILKNYSYCSGWVTLSSSSNVPMGAPLQVTSTQHCQKEERASEQDPELEMILQCQVLHWIWLQGAGHNALKTHELKCKEQFYISQMISRIFFKNAIDFTCDTAESALTP